MILKTALPQSMAVLDCTEEVSANTLFSLEVGGSLVAEAVVGSAEEIVPRGAEAQFLPDHRSIHGGVTAESVKLAEAREYLETQAILMAKENVSHLDDKFPENPFQ